MSQINVTLHLVFATKNRMPYLMNEALRKSVFKHIRLYSYQKKIFIQEINGWSDHLHVLLNLQSTQRICDVVQQIKGESSRWISSKFNKDFAWQGRYYAESVGKSDLKRITNYIRNQEGHHSDKSS